MSYDDYSDESTGWDDWEDDDDDETLLDDAERGLVGLLDAAAQKWRS